MSIYPEPEPRLGNPFRMCCISRYQVVSVPWPLRISATRRIPSNRKNCVYQRQRQALNINCQRLQIRQFPPLRSFREQSLRDDSMEGWLEAAGAIGLDGLELADFPGVGRGVRTRRQFKEAETILTIPRGVLWTVKRAYADPRLGPALRSVQSSLSNDDTLAIYILFVRSRESQYDGPQSHVAALPTKYSSSIFFTEDELNVCAGTSLYAITKQLQQQIEGDYKALVVRLLGSYLDLFELDKFTIEDYKWALCTVWSRAMDFELSDGNSIRLMAPYADMLNHSSKIKQSHVYDASSGNLSILAGKNYEVGDQVFINYGAIPNNRLLRLYGFAIPDNPHDSYDLVLSTHPDAPFFEQKHELWLLAGLDSTSTVSLSFIDPLPKTILRYLRIQRLGESDLALVALEQIDATDKKISDRNEMEILNFLIQSISHSLQSFGTHLERLEEQLADGFYTPGENAWAAAHVSIGEQKVLRLAKKAAEDLLAAEEGAIGNEVASSSALTQCANCRRVLDQPKLCARCKAVAYCGRTCQTTHYKKHKATCLATIQSRETNR